MDSFVAPLAIVCLSCVLRGGAPLRARRGQNQRNAPDATTLRGLAKLAEMFFLAVSGTQLALVLLVAPAATAGAICLDRARGTLSHMLMTDLTNAEIVLGKLAGRLVPVLVLLGCVLPLMEILTLLGGVDPNALLGGFAVSLGVAVFGCTLAMAFSLWVRKTHEALLGTYAVLTAVAAWPADLEADRALVRMYRGPCYLSRQTHSSWHWRRTGGRAACRMATMSGSW